MVLLERSAFPSLSLPSPFSFFSCFRGANLTSLDLPLDFVYHQQVPEWIRSDRMFRLNHSFYRFLKQTALLGLWQLCGHSYDWRWPLHVGLVRYRRYALYPSSCDLSHFLIYTRSGGLRSPSSTVLSPDRRFLGLLQCHIPCIIWERQGEMVPWSPPSLSRCSVPHRRHTNRSEGWSSSNRKTGETEAEARHFRTRRAACSGTWSC